jgi:hypothetical protein
MRLRWYRHISFFTLANKRLRFFRNFSRSAGRGFRGAGLVKGIAGLRLCRRRLHHKLGHGAYVKRKVFADALQKCRIESRLRGFSGGGAGATVMMVPDSGGGGAENMHSLLANWE